MVGRTLTTYPEVVRGFSAAADGTMSLNGGVANRRRYLGRHGLNPNRTVDAGLCHGAQVTIVTTAQAGQIIEDTDGLVTTEAHLGLAMTAADCLLVYAYDPRGQVIGLAHAGWRGLATDILPRFIAQFQSLGSQSTDLVITVGPSICMAHYQVDDHQALAEPAAAAKFRQYPQALQTIADKTFLDLRLVARQQLLTAGVEAGQLTFDPRCTYEDHRLFSYRRDHPPTPQVQVGYLMRRA